MTEEQTSSMQRTTGPSAFGMSAAVYALRDGKILILKRAGGELTGAWDVPGGMVDAGENTEQTALRELREEASITPSGPLTLVGLVPMHVYGQESFRAMYACDCAEGEVAISHEHSGHRWIDPREYRDRYFGDEQLHRVAEGSERRATIVRNVRANLDEYIARLDHEFEDRQLRTMRMTADMFVIRDGQMLILKRQGGIGDGAWDVPGGVVEPGEDPVDAAARETLEESGLSVEAPKLLRVWSWRAQNEIDAYHATYIAESPAGDVTVSHEHSGARWIDPAEYADRYLKAEFETSVPAFATWFPQVRRNIELVQQWIDQRG